MKKVVGYGLAGFGVLLMAPAWCAMGEGTIYDAASYVSMPAWLLMIVGFGFVGLGNFIQGPSLAERRSKREAESAALQVAKARALRQRPDYQALRQRRDELSEAADLADEAGDIDRRDVLRDEWYAVCRELEALRRDSSGSA